MDEFIKTPNQDGQSPVEHKRRVRYQGTHPRRYEEKYKELNPEKYQADVEKIIQQGKTPAGMHIPIMVCSEKSNSRLVLFVNEIVVVGFSVLCCDLDSLFFHGNTPFSATVIISIPYLVAPDKRKSLFSLFL